MLHFVQHDRLAFWDSLSGVSSFLFPFVLDAYIIDEAYFQKEMHGVCAKRKTNIVAKEYRRVLTAA
jgi:hypothetical protein